MRATGNRNFLFREIETIGSSGSDERNRLERLTGRSNVSHGIRPTQLGDRFARAVDGCEVAAMPGFNNRPSPNFD